MDKVVFKNPWFRRKLYLSRKPYFLKRSRSEGERDLEKLTDIGEVEGCWLFDVDGSFWYNIGHANGTITNREGCNGLTLRTYPFDLSELRQVSHYHIHPKIMEDELNEKLKFQVSQEEKKVVANYASLNLAIPSNGDIITYLKILQGDPNTLFDFRIVSPHGLLTLNFDEFVEAEYTKKRYFEARNDKQLMEIASKGRNVRGAISQGIDYINGAMEHSFKIKFEDRV